MRLAILLATCVVLGAPAVRSQVTNGSFETGDFTGWTTTDVDRPLSPLAVEPAGAVGYFGTPTQPTEGSFSVLTGFEGVGPGVVALRQELTVTKSAPVLLLDYVAQWDLKDAVTTSKFDRTFGVELWRDAGWLGAFEVLRAHAQTKDLAGDRVTAAVSLAGHAGKPLQLGLVWSVPEVLTGPAFFELDNVRLAGPKLPVLERAGVDVVLDLVEQDHDVVKLDLVVPVPPDFAPAGELLTVGVGDLVRDFTLDASGGAHEGPNSAELLPVPQHPDHRRLKVVCQQGNFAADFVAHGLLDVDTGEAGTTVTLPITVGLAGETTSRELVGVYKAVAGLGGSAAAKAASETWTSSLSVKLNLMLADESTLHMRTSALVSPGFAPDGKDVRVDIGDWSRTFTLDATGAATSTVDTDGVNLIKLVRDKRNPARQVVTVIGKHGNFWDVDEEFSGIFPTPPGGLHLHIPVSVTIEGRTTRNIVTVTYKATLKSGKASS